ncbi:MAG: HAMP domain-containing protein [Acidobacteria bacterium]|nr:HAMP domain-containing protein [Acidobacteriota bacterium]
MHSRFFWRLYVTYFSLVVITAGAIGFLTDRQFERALNLRVEGELLKEGAALVPGSRSVLLEGDRARAQSMVEEVSRSTGTRVTIVLPDGSVLADSSEDPARMGNHGDRPEIRRALAEGTGMVRRFSETTQTDRVYFATLVRDNGTPLGVVRTSETLANIGAQRAAMRSQVIRGAGIGVLLALGIGLFVVGRFTAPIEKMTEVSESLRRGEYDARVRFKRTDELGRLGANLNQLGRELSDRISGLGRQQAQLRAFLGAMQEGVVAIDVRDRVVFSNAMGRRMLHLDPGEHDLALVQMPGGVLDVLAEVRESGTRTHSEITQTIDDEDIVLDVRGAPFEAAEESGVVLVLYDITSVRRLERVRTDFVANVSHELKTPLTSIRGYIETLLDGAIHDDEYNVRFLEKSHAQVNRLTTLVSDLLSLARIESTALTSEPEPVDLREIITESVTYRRDHLLAKQLELEVDLPDEPLLTEGEAEGMRQIIDNLLDNAINYTPAEREISIRLTAENYDAVLRIEDTGIGIPEEALGRIFERFYRVDKGRSREVGGTGLGLSIVRNLVQRMQGTVSVESEVGVGTTFTVILPRADEPVVISESEPLD